MGGRPALRAQRRKPRLSRTILRDHSVIRSSIPSDTIVRPGSIDLDQWDDKCSAGSTTAWFPDDRLPAASFRPIAGERDALHDTALAVVVVHRVVLCAAIVP